MSTPRKYTCIPIKTSKHSHIKHMQRYKEKVEPFITLKDAIHAHNKKRNTIHTNSHSKRRLNNYAYKNDTVLIDNCSRKSRQKDKFSKYDQATLKDIFRYSCLTRSRPFLMLRLYKYYK